MKVFGLQGNEYIWLAGCDRRSEWLTKQREEKKQRKWRWTRDRDGKRSKYRSCGGGSTVFYSWL